MLRHERLNDEALHATEGRARSQVRLLVWPHAALAGSPSQRHCSRLVRKPTAYCGPRGALDRFIDKAPWCAAT